MLGSGGNFGICPTVGNLSTLSGTMAVSGYGECISGSSPLKGFSLYAKGGDISTACE